MSEGFVPENNIRFYSEEYHAEWKVTNLMSYKDKKLVTPPFCPLSNFDFKFSFEVLFLEYSSDQHYHYTVLKIVLIKLDGSNAPALLKLDMNTQLETLDGKLLKVCPFVRSVTVKDIDHYHFDKNIALNIQKSNNNLCINGYTINMTESFLLKCRMKFCGHLGESSAPYRSLLPVLSKPSETSLSDVKSLKRCDASSDIIIHVESKLFLAHKAVLFNHSPVLKQLITRSNDKSLLEVSDENSDAFDTFLDYLYSGNFEYTSWPMLRDLYVLSAKYEVETLKQKCVAAILPIISADKVSEILKMACDYDDLGLKAPAAAFAVKHIRDIISSEEWKELIISHPLIGHEITIAALTRN